MSELLSEGKIKILTFYLSSKIFTNMIGKIRWFVPLISCILFPFSILSDDTDKKGNYDFYSENQYSTMERELEQRKDSNTGVDDLFIYKSVEDDNKSGSTNKNQAAAFKNQIIERKVKVHLNNNTVITGITPFYGEEIEIITENSGIEYTKLISRSLIRSIEFMNWICMEKVVLNGQDGYSREKYYFVPSKAKILLQEDVVVEGKINPFDFLSFSITNAHGRGNYTTFFYDLWEPDPELLKTNKEKKSQQSTENTESVFEQSQSDNEGQVQAETGDTTDKQNIVYKWKYLKTQGKIYNANQMPEWIVKRIEVISSSANNEK